MKTGFHILLTLTLTLKSTFALSEQISQTPILDPNGRFHPIVGQKGMAVSQEIVASQVGADILSKGGNAIDSAVGIGFALAVTLPRAGNLGGGGFMMVYLAEEDKTIAIDYREMAPSNAHRDMFLDEEQNVDKQKARYSAMASGVPGTVAGLIHAQRKYGKLTLASVIQPAIDLAEQGIKVTYDMAGSLAARSKMLQENFASAKYFYHKDGSNYRYGELLRQQDLANTLKRIQADGRKGFYQGKTADLIIDEMKRSNGLINRKDLINYRVVEREPVCSEYKGKRICAMPPPSSGGVHLIQMLNMLEKWDLKSMGHNSASYLHVLIETMRRAYADRSKYLGDPDFYNVPVDKLIDKKYANILRKKIDPNKASLSTDIYPGASLPKESMETTHFSTWDKWGNTVSNTYTLNFSFGNGISVDGAGFLLNNEMNDFSAKPGVPNGFGLLGGEANSVEPGKRPLSSMTPTIVYDQNGKPSFVTGSPGGSTIINVVLQNLLNVVEFDMNVAEAMSAPRIHHQWMPDKVDFESGLSPDTINILKNMGHQLGRKRVLGSTQSINVNKEGIKFGGSDYRRNGAGAVAQDH